MGKVRRYKKKLAALAATGTGETDKTGEQPGNVDCLELAVELMNLNKDDDKVSVCSVKKSLKSTGESLKLKKDTKRYLKHAMLIKKLEKSFQKNKKKKSVEGIDVNDELLSHLKVLDWPDKNPKTVATQSGPPKKHRKGFQKKQNAQLAKDLVLFSKKIKKQPKKSSKNVK